MPGGHANIPISRNIELRERHEFRINLDLFQIIYAQRLFSNLSRYDFLNSSIHISNNQILASQPFQYFSRISRLSILPVGFIGKESIKSTDLGHLYPARCALQ